jgi:hypothetical protein
VSAADLEQRLQALLDKQEIAELSHKYMRALDRLDRDLMLSVFHPDSTTDYGFFQGSGPDFVDYAQNALKDHISNQHLIGQILIDLEGDIAFGEVYYQAFHRFLIDGVETDLFVAGRYVDRYERRNEIWKFAFRSELVDWVRLDPATGKGMMPGAIWGARGADDLSSQRDRVRAL